MSENSFFIINEAPPKVITVIQRNRRRKPVLICGPNKKLLFLVLLQYLVRENPSLQIALKSSLAVT
jgi:hypothetical protein